MENGGKTVLKLLVDNLELKDAGRGIIRIGPEQMKTLQMDIGDVIAVKGQKMTCARVMVLPVEKHHAAVIQMDELTMGNAGAAKGTEVEVFRVEAKKAAKITVTESSRTTVHMKKFEGEYVKKMLRNHCICTGDYFFIQHLGPAKSTFKVTSAFPPGVVIIDENTVVSICDDSDVTKAGSHVSFKDIGGLEQQVLRIKEIIEYPITYSEMFSQLHLEPSRGILLYGPPGTGKTLIAKAIANEIGGGFLSINGPEIVNKYYGESEAKLREIFEQAKTNAPGVIFIDELDAIAPKREEVQGDVEKRIVAQLLSLMDGLNERSNVIVIGATNLPNSLDPALRRPGRFDKEIYIGVPDESARLGILRIHTKKTPLAEDVDLPLLASITHGYVGADLCALCREASMNCIRRIIAEHPSNSGVFSSEPDNLKVCWRDFLLALNEVQPSAIREVMVEIPNITWDMIGGLKTVKRRLRESIEWPLKYPSVFSVMNMKLPKGILLYGLPGTGKTLVARAIATESGANFISVKGPELLSKWQGETEKGVREVFRKAKQTAPCVVFFDEIDSLAGLNDHGAPAQSTVIAQLLTEMDGIEVLENVIVVGATNRIDTIDKALLRDGRFEMLMKFDLPDKDGRKEIFRLHLKNKPLAEDADIERLADLTQGFSGADIEGVCKRAAFSAIRNFLESNGEAWKDTQSLKITQKDMEIALKNRIEE